MTASIPLSIYIHIPWCVKKCPYCDFNSHQKNQLFDEAQYIAALITDLKAQAPLAENRPIVSIFIGGGTPSLFQPESIAALLEEVRRHYSLSSHCEITMEANPGAAEHGAFTGYRAAGINRLSFGIQSTNNHQLKQLGRIHSIEAAEESFLAARAAGFDNINCDLMFGLPEQSVHAALDELARLTAWQPEHFSWYELTLEPNTLFFKRPPALPSTDEKFAMQQEGVAYLASKGFQRYEISAYSRNNLLCKHNCNYWEYGDYLGIGAGASQKISLPEGSIQRLTKQKHPSTYMNNPLAHYGLEMVIDPCFEFLMNRLRLLTPFSLALFEERTGLDAEILQQRIAPFLKKGWLIAPEETTLQISETGLLWLDSLLADCL